MSRTLSVVDADGHVLEPLDLWVRYVDPQFRGRAKPFVDENGKDWISIDGKVLGGMPGIGLSRTGAIGVAKDDIPKMKYTDGRKGGFDPLERLKDLDIDGIDAVVLYPSLGLFAGAVKDPELAAGLARAYNRWLAEYCSASPDRLYGVAMLPLQSIELAIEEMRFARTHLGFKTGFIRPNPYNNRLLSNPDYGPLWAAAQDLDFSIALHEGSAGDMGTVAADRFTGGSAKHIVSHTMEMMLACLNLIWNGVCEKYPRVRFAFMESGGGWIVPWLDRMDRHFDRKGVWDEAGLTMRPSDYFRRQCWISFEPIEHTIASTAQYLGADRLLWATDYPHPDGYFPGAPKMVADQLPASLRAKVMAKGAIDFYKLN